MALVMVEEPKFISATIFAPNIMSAEWPEAGGCRACHGTDRGGGYNNHRGGLKSLARPSLKVQAQVEVESGVEECVQEARDRRPNDYEGISPWSYADAHILNAQEAGKPSTLVSINNPLALQFTK